LKLQVNIRPNYLPTEGRKGTISLKIIPLDDESHKEFQVATSIFAENVQSIESFENPINIDLSDGESEANFSIRYPTCTTAAIRVYVLGLGDDDELLDENGANNHFKFQTRGRTIPHDTRYINRPIKVYSWFELILFFFAGMSTIGAIFEGISLWKSFQ
jgi:hypothetical protein